MSVALASAVAPPVMIGLFVWWAVVLAAPVVVVRRCRRGRLAHGQYTHPPVGQSADGDAVSRELRSEDDPRPVASGWAAYAVPRKRSLREAERSAVSREPLEPLCRHVDFARRLNVAVEELERRLSVLPRELWRVERYPLTGERRNTVLVLGATGVFVISATYAPGCWDDLVTVHGLAGKIQQLLANYPGRVQSAVCHPFSSLPPRAWNRPDEHGEWIAAWLLGGDSVIEWLEHFGTEHGLAPADLLRFDDLSKPNWLHPAIPARPSWPQLPYRSTAPNG